MPPSERMVLACVTGAATRLSTVQTHITHMGIRAFRIMAATLIIVGLAYPAATLEHADGGHLAPLVGWILSSHNSCRRKRMRGRDLHAPATANQCVHVGLLQVHALPSCPA